VSRGSTDDLKRRISGNRAELRPRFEIGLDTHRLIERMGILSGLDERQLERVAQLLRPRFTVPNERIPSAGGTPCSLLHPVLSRWDCRHAACGSAAASSSGKWLCCRVGRVTPDVVALTYCRLLVLRKADFERFLAANPEAKAEINRIVETRLSVNQEDGDWSAETVLD
jgi:monovalent cation:H+ antiporter, CPA1 family